MLCGPTKEQQKKVRMGAVSHCGGCALWLLRVSLGSCLCSLVCKLQIMGPPDAASSADINVTIKENLKNVVYYVNGSVTIGGFNYMVRKGSGACNV